MKRKIQWQTLLKKLSPYTLMKGLRYLRHYGLKEFWIRLHERFEPEEVPYQEWFEKARSQEQELERQRKKRFSISVKISIVVPVYHTPARYLTQMMEAVLAQTYANWELCLANAGADDETVRVLLDTYSRQDPRIRVKTLKENAGIAQNTNEALEMATGDWIGFLDHDDVLAPEALYYVVEAINTHPDAWIIYSDEDKVTEDLSEHFQPHFKPDFNLDLLRSNNYICHFLLLSRRCLTEAGSLSTDYDGAQDYELIFRCVEKALGMPERIRFGQDVGERIVHIPKILYHWRTHRSSTADNPDSKQYAFDAGNRAISDHLVRMQTPGEVVSTLDHGFYRVRYQIQSEPLVSVIIPTKDHPELLKTCIDSLLARTDWKKLEILVVDNDSKEPETLRLFEELKAQGIRILHYPEPFNYSAINNYAARQADGEFLVFLNNDIEIISGNWIRELLGVCSRPEVGATGVRLIYPNHTIQHAGIVIGIGGIAGSLFVDMPAERTGYLHKASLLQDLSAVTAACMMIRTEAFWSVGGFSEKLAVAFNDVDLCLKLRREGWLIVYDPYCQQIHNESSTRGPEDTEEKVRRFQSEIEYMRTHWLRILKDGDPYYNPNLSLSKWNYSIAPLD